MTAAEIRARRLQLGLTQAELAVALEVTPNTVARWERGETTIGRPGVLRIVLDALAQQHAAIVEQAHESHDTTTRQASER